MPTIAPSVRSCAGIDKNCAFCAVKKAHRRRVTAECRMFSCQQIIGVNIYAIPLFYFLAIKQQFS